MNIKKEIREWSIFIAVLGILYFTGLYTEVAGFAQRVVLTSGLITPNTEIEGVTNEKLDYNFKLIDLEGNIVPMENFKNKVIFINEWATWCPPCIAEMPSIQNLYDEIGDNENIVFVMLTLDGNKKKIEKFIQKKDFTFPIYGAASALPEVLKSASIPTTFVVSKTGDIISKKVGMAKYDTDKFKAFMLEASKK
ncbi:MAG: TlpA family protein disulfide reductase [Cyclobacteriaceae bacterium]|nr:TlpA family protein disulfide reductase [Cyclobacteriaceae bacterium]